MLIFLEILVLFYVHQTRTSKEFIIHHYLKPRLLLEKVLGTKWPTLNYLIRMNGFLHFQLWQTQQMMEGQVPQEPRVQRQSISFASLSNPQISNAIVCPDDPLGPKPSSRWFKRLKMSTSDTFAHGTKSSKNGRSFIP